MKNRYTGFSDKFHKRLWENDDILYYVLYLDIWVKGKIIFKDDIPRAAHRYATEILNVDNSKNVKKLVKKYHGVTIKSGKNESRTN